MGTSPEDVVVSAAVVSRAVESGRAGLAPPPAAAAPAPAPTTTPVSGVLAAGDDLGGGTFSFDESGSGIVSSTARASPLGSVSITLGSWDVETIRPPEAVVPTGVPGSGEGACCEGLELEAGAEA
jgi:hypothetical protein